MITNMNAITPEYLKYRIEQETEQYKQEIERLKEDNKYLNKVNVELSTEKNELNNIIKEALILIEHTRYEEQYASDEILLPILNKLRESEIRNYIKVEGSDKE